jgi:hypothetical protein
VGLERDPLSLVGTIEELSDRKYSGPGLETEITALGIRHADYAEPSMRKHWHQLRREAVVAWSVKFARELRPRSSVLRVDTDG